MITLKKAAAFGGVIATAFAAFAPANPALAATVEWTGGQHVYVRGVIEPGDDERFDAAILQARLGRKIVKSLWLDSPGGNVAAGIKLAAAVSEAEVHTVVSRGETCSSICVLVYAVGKHRFAFASSRIGVHAVSMHKKDSNGEVIPDAPGIENERAKTLTVDVGRLLAECGVPYQIIGKMMSTKPDAVEWLSAGDAKLWGIEFLDAPPKVASTEPTYVPPMPEPALIPAPQPQYIPPPPPPPQPTYMPPADTRTPGQKVYDWALRSEGTPMAKSSELMGYDWTGKIEYFKSMGAQFTTDCGGGVCKYRGELWSPNRQVRYYLQRINGERVFCVKNYRTGNGACANQDTDEMIYLRKVGTNDRWLKA
jgi:hypothetical protein